MTPEPVTAAQLRERLRAVTDPALESDIVSLGLVTDVRLADDVAVVSLAFNAPLSPTEWRMCDEIRALCRGVGLEPRLYGDGTADADRGPFPGVRNAVGIAAPDEAVGSAVVAANLAGALASIGARVGVLDLDAGVDRRRRTWLDAVDPPDCSGGPIVPREFRGVPTVTAGSFLPDPDSESGSESVSFPDLLERLERLEWGALDYLLVRLPAGAGPTTQRALERASTDGTVVAVPAARDPTSVDADVRALDRIDATVLGVVRTAEIGDRTATDVGRNAALEYGRSASEFGRTDESDSTDSEIAPRYLGCVPLDGSSIEPKGSDESGADDRVNTLPRGLDAVDDGGPFHRLAVAVADRVGAVNRRAVASKSTSASESDRTG